MIWLNLLFSFSSLILGLVMFVLLPLVPPTTPAMLLGLTGEYQGWAGGCIPREMSALHGGTFLLRVLPGHMLACQSALPQVPFC